MEKSVKQEKYLRSYIVRGFRCMFYFVVFLSHNRGEDIEGVLEPTILSYCV